MIFRFALAAICVVAFSSCEDKALIQKNEKLRVEISELEKKVSMLEVEAGEDPGEQTELLKQSNEALRLKMEELEKLDAEKERLESEHVKLEKDFREYQGKYKIK